MSFRKRNIGLGRAENSEATASSTTVSREHGTSIAQDTPSAPPTLPGTRPSPVDGRLTTSTGTPTLDTLLAGHAGLALGHSIILEENGTTDYTGSLLKYYAAEGIVQAHTVHIVGTGEGWARGLPGLVGPADHGVESVASHRGGEAEKMKIAWRYEKLGRVGEAAGQRVPSNPAASSGNASAAPPTPFCHIFDLAKRLTIPASANICYVPVSTSPRGNPFASILQHLSSQLRDSQPNTVHRVVIPSLLSPAIYPPQASQPPHLIQFFHSLRSLLRQYPSQLTVMASIPLELYPRDTGLLRWLELLVDGVIEFTPFPHAFDEGPSTLSTSGAATSQEEQPQGMVKVHKVPVFHERGGGGGGLKSMGDDLAFTVSRRRFTIKPFSLPPAEGDTEAQKGGADGAPEAKKLTKEQIDF